MNATNFTANIGLLLAISLFLQTNPLFAAQNCLEVCFEGNSQSRLLCEQKTEADTLHQSGQLYLKLKDDFNIDLEYKMGETCETRAKLFHKEIASFGIYAIAKAFPRLPEMDKYWRIRFSRADLANELIRNLERFEFVEFAEKVPLYKKFLTPNDIHPDQYNVLITQAEQAWDITTGNNQIVIGMVDDAVLLNHEDLAANIWTNPGEIAGNAVDDDGNGYVDDINGYDTGDNDNDPNPPAYADNFTFSHGTHCAGIAAAATDNGIGIAAPSFNVQLMAVKIADDVTEALTGAMAGVEYAIAAGAHIISMSWGGGAPSATNQAVFDIAHDAGIVLVAAAGNDNTDVLMYPASYEHVISVGASDQNDLRANFSNYGDSIDVMAPGVDIWSTVATNNSAYEFYDGTSMACPFVSGLAALMLSLDPNLSPERVEYCLESTADNIDGLNPGFAGQLGAGRVNAHQAMLCVPSEPLASFSADFVGNACAGVPITFYDHSGGIAPLTWQWDFPGATPASSNLQNPTVTFPTDGSYDVTLTVTNGLGTDQITQSIIVAPPTATLSGSSVIIAGFSTNIMVELTGTPPWSFTYFDGVSNTTITGITYSPYLISVSPAQTTTYTPVEVQDANCYGWILGEALVISETPEGCVDCPYYLVEEVLIGGSCLNVSNVTFTGNADMLGYFEQQPDLDIGFAEGVAITTGPGSIIYGPNNQNGAGSDAFQPGDSDLDAIITPFDTHDAAVLEFDFVPSSSDLTFNYVFASEEYPEYVCSQFNDVFAFLISGPGIIGQQNLAIVPGTANMAVAINSVNSGAVGANGTFANCTSLTNDAYYIGTPTGSMSTQYDGLTVPLTATASGLIPCETYHIKLAIADAGDGILDSSVFLEANSFSAGPEIDVSAIGGVAGSGEIYEGCDAGYFVFTRNETSDFSLPFVVDFTIGGNATMAPLPDADYPSLPSNITIAAGDSTALLPIEAFADDLVEGTEVITISLDNIQCDCSNIPITAYLYVVDNGGFDAGEPEEICPGESVQLNTTGGVSHTWTPATGLSNPNIGSPIASPDETTIYHVSATDINGCVVEDSLIVFIAPLPYLEPIELDTTFCFSDTVFMSISNITTAISNYDYEWSPATGLDNPSIHNPIATITESTTYVLTVSNQYGCTATESVEITVHEVEVDIAATATDLCPGETAVLSAGAGFGSYEWSTGEQTPSITVSATGDYYVTVSSDSLACLASDMLTVNLFDLGAIDAGATQTICPGESIELNPSGGFGHSWQPAASLSDPNIANPIASPNQSTMYYVSAVDSNGCTITDSVMIAVAALPVLDVYDLDTTLCISDTAFLNLGDFVTPAPGQNYEWSPIMGLDNPFIYSPVASISESITYIVETTNVLGCTLSDSVRINVEPFTLSIDADDGEICPGESIALGAGAGFAAYEWSNGATTASITVSDAGDYFVTVTNGSFNCLATDVVAVGLLPSPDVEIAAVDEMYEGVSTPLYALPDTLGQYAWSTGETASGITITTGGDYYVTVTNEHGCMDWASISVETLPVAAFLFPTPFRPTKTA